VEYRQWVLSFGGPLAVRLGYDRSLLAAVSRRLARVLTKDIRRSVKQRHALASVAPPHAGVVVVVQRFRSDLGLYVHLHCLVTDGAFEERGGDLDFLDASPPTPERMLASFRYELAKLWKSALERRGERTRVRWDRMSRLIARWLPLTRVCHPYPEVRFRARTQGRSPVR